jgi:hypothetical protein
MRQTVNNIITATAGLAERRLVQARAYWPVLDNTCVRSRRNVPMLFVTDQNKPRKNASLSAQLATERTPELVEANR